MIFMPESWGGLPAQYILWVQGSGVLNQAICKRSSALDAPRFHL